MNAQAALLILRRFSCASILPATHTVNNRIMTFSTCIRWALGLAIAPLALLSCNTLKEEDPHIVVTFTEFTADLFQERDALTGAPAFGLWVESVKEYGCGNYRVEAVTEVSAGSIMIRLQDVQAPDTCLGLPGPARGFLPVGPLADGTYQFTFTLNPVLVSRGTLTVQNGHYALAISDQEGVDFQNRVLETLAADYVWGYALTPAEPDQPVADQFLQQLKPLTDEPALAPGYYGDFTVTGTGQYFFHRSIAPAGSFRPFLRRFDPAGAAGVRSVLEAYRQDQVRPLEIKCYSTLGEF